MLLQLSEVTTDAPKMSFAPVLHRIDQPGMVKPPDLEGALHHIVARLRRWHKRLLPPAHVDHVGKVVIERAAVIVVQCLDARVVGEDEVLGDVGDWSL